jgi:hypothetical protein
MKTYRLSPAGRRTALILMLAVILLWLFALWMLPSTLGVRVLELASSLRERVATGLSVSQFVQTAILIVMVVAAPLLVWNLWEEWNTSYTVGDDGLTYRTTNAVTLHYPWSHVREIRADGDHKAEVLVSDEGVAPIRHPVVRWLHRQGFSQGRIPIYAGVEARDTLIAEIARHSGARRA